MESIMFVVFAFIIIGLVMGLALLGFFGGNNNIASAQTTTTPQDVFSYSCNQLQTLVNYNINIANNQIGGSPATYFAVLAQDYLSIMQLKGCNEVS